MRELKREKLKLKCKSGEQLVLIEKADKILAAKALGNVIYRDEEVVEALQTLEGDKNKELQQTIKETLGKIHEVQRSYR